MQGAATCPHEVERVELLLLLRLFRLDCGQARLHHIVHRVIYFICMVPSQTASSHGA